MEQKINIELHRLSGLKVKGFLEVQPSWSDSGIELVLSKSNLSTRGSPDPTTLVAIVGVAGPAIGALISGLLQIAQQNASKKIVLHSKGGAVLEIPSGTKTEEIDKLIEKLNQMDLEKIILP